MNTSINHNTPLLERKSMCPGKPVDNPFEQYSDAGDPSPGNERKTTYRPPGKARDIHEDDDED